MTHVRFAPEVPDELAEAVLWYEARRQELGSEFLDEVQAILPLIGRRPRSFPRLQDVDATIEIRRALLARFPLPPASELRGWLAQLRIQRRADGGLAIEAPPEAADGLAAPFEGMGSLLREAGRAHE